MVRSRTLRYGVIHLKILATYIRKHVMYSNLLWGNMSSLINVSSYRTRVLVFFHLMCVTLITTYLFEMCDTVPTQETPGVLSERRFCLFPRFVLNS